MSENIYESPRLRDEYLLFHYGSEAEVFPDSAIPYPEAMRSALGFTQRTVDHFSTSPVARALDLGCAVGGSTFALAAQAKEVIGIDYSHAFIDAAASLQQGNTLSYQRHDEAHQYSELHVNPASANLRRRCQFEQGDAMDLRADLGAFDRVHAANLLCRLPRPLDLLDRLPELTKSGGELVLATPCTWLEEFTPTSAWPTADTLSWLTQILEKHFTLRLTTHEPFLIRETARKFQWSHSLVTLWQRH